MPNPYETQAPAAFWKKAMAETGGQPGLPLPAHRFRLDSGDTIATAGSCFAQNVAKFLRTRPAVSLIEAETLGPDDPVFSGRYGNIYTVRQLVELIDEVATGRVDPACAIRRRDGRWVDVFRPFIDPAGFDSAAAVIAARQAHITAIAPVFTQPKLFVFTLGLTEAWKAAGVDGRVYPVCPGVYADDPARPYSFVNYDYPAVMADLDAALTRLQTLNPGVKVMLTVSPVPLTATFSGDHVLTATMMSKAVLRAAAGAAATREGVFYFPSYEMIANPFTTTTAYADNLRSVRQDAVDTIMAAFEAVYMRGDTAPTAAGAALSADAGAPPEDVVCDDVEIENSMGF